MKMCDGSLHDLLKEVESRFESMVNREAKAKSERDLWRRVIKKILDNHGKMTDTQMEAARNLLGEDQ